MSSVRVVTSLRCSYSLLLLAMLGVVRRGSRVVVVVCALLTGVAASQCRPIWCKWPWCVWMSSPTVLALIFTVGGRREDISCPQPPSAASYAFDQCNYRDRVVALPHSRRRSRRSTALRTLYPPRERIAKKASLIRCLCRQSRPLLTVWDAVFFSFPAGKQRRLATQNVR